MNKYAYILIGGGMATAAALEGIREIDQLNEILVISGEKFPPYNRPPLSKGLWKGKDLETIWRNLPDMKLELKLDTRVARVDPHKKVVETGTGEQFGFEQLLLATGGTARRLPFSGDDVIYYRDLADYQKLRDLATPGKRFGVIGSGFIGSEIAAALALNGLEVQLFDIGPGIGWNIFPEPMVNFLNDYYQEKGVQVIPNVTVADIQTSGSVRRIRLSNGEQYEVDAVVAGIGIKPQTDLAEAAGLIMSNGIVVDELLRTSSPDIFAAGDAANFYNPTLDQRIRVEHADNANAMGRQAGRNMAGAAEPYHYLPLFYSDLFDLGYEAVGELRADAEITADWQEKYQKGVLYYLKDERVRGVLLWNVWDKVEEARKVIGMPGPVNPGELKGKIA
jgi:NADPH-dependent 2,4-dienoyl-CoA reductase/sulfur reductase-like enzyme